MQEIGEQVLSSGMGGDTERQEKPEQPVRIGKLSFQSTLDMELGPLQSPFMTVLRWA